MTIAIVYIHTCRHIHTGMHTHATPHTHTQTHKQSFKNTLRHINAHSFKALYHNSHDYNVT